MWSERGYAATVLLIKYGPHKEGWQC